VNEYNREVLQGLRATLKLYSDGPATSVEDLQHRLATTAGLLDRGADEIARTLHSADADCEMLLFATPSDQRRQQLRKLAQALQVKVDVALTR